jgi:hypothetical protein
MSQWKKNTKHDSYVICRCSIWSQNVVWIQPHLSTSLSISKFHENEFKGILRVLVVEHIGIWMMFLLPKRKSNHLWRFLNPNTPRSSHLLQNPDEGVIDLGGCWRNVISLLHSKNTWVAHGLLRESVSNLIAKFWAVEEGSSWPEKDFTIQVRVENCLQSYYSISVMKYLNPAQLHCLYCFALMLSCTTMVSIHFTCCIAQQ